MTSKSDEKFMRQWEKTLQKGRLRHHLTIGIIWGFTFYLIINLLELKDMSFVEAYFSRKALIKLGVWFISGIAIFAPFLWWDTNRRYKALKEKRDRSDNPS